MKYYKINIKIYNSLSGIKRIEYLKDCEMFLDPFKEGYWG